MSRQTSLQLTPATERQVEYLRQEGFGNFTDIVRLAIDRMYRREFRLRDIASHHTIEIYDTDADCPICGQTLEAHLKNNSAVDYMAFWCPSCQDYQVVGGGGCPKYWPRE